MCEREKSNGLRSMFVSLFFLLHPRIYWLDPKKLQKEKCNVSFAKDREISMYVFTLCERDQRKWIIDKVYVFNINWLDLTISLPTKKYQCMLLPCVKKKKRDTWPRSMFSISINLTWQYLYLLKNMEKFISVYHYHVWKRKKNRIIV